VTGVQTCALPIYDQLVLSKADRDNQRAVMRRNELLYVIVGDPALRPLSPLAPAAAAPASN
jgi:hypothetical protein